MNENTQTKPKIALALGAGGSRGFAHIGILKAFEEENIPIGIITGASIGAIVGGLYAAGVPIKEIKHKATTMRRMQFMDITLPSKGGFIKGARAVKFLNEILEQSGAATTFSKTKIKFGCVATDLVAGQSVELTKGPLMPAIHASFAIGGVFKPVKQNGMLLVDGGPLCRVPVRLARKLGADVVVGVDCAGPTIPVKPSSLGNYVDILTRHLLILEYASSKHEIEESDYLISMIQSNIDPMKLDFAKESIENGYQEGKKMAKRLKQDIKNL